MGEGRESGREREIEREREREREIGIETIFNILSSSSSYSITMSEGIKTAFEPLDTESI